jgi:hypothetical protein
MIATTSALESEHFIVVEDDRVVLEVVNREMAELG